MSLCPVNHHLTCSPIWKKMTKSKYINNWKNRERKNRELAIVNLEIWKKGPKTRNKNKRLFTKRPAADSKWSSTKYHPHVRSKTSVTSDFPTVGVLKKCIFFGHQKKEKNACLVPPRDAKWMGKGAIKQPLRV